MKKTLVILLLMGIVALHMGCQRRDAVVAEPESSSSQEEEISPSQPEPEPESSQEESSEAEEVDTVEVELAVQELMAAIQSGNRETIQGKIDYRNLIQLESDSYSDANLMILASHLKYEILSAHTDGVLATVQVQLTNLDMGKLFAGYINAAMEMEYNNYLVEERMTPQEVETAAIALFKETLAANSQTTTTTTVDLVLMRSSNRWKPQVSQELREAVFGGYFAASKQVAEAAQG